MGATRRRFTEEYKEHAVVVLGRVVDTVHIPQQTPDDHPVHLRERLPRRHARRCFLALGGTAASADTTYLLRPPRPGPHTVAARP